MTSPLYRILIRTGVALAPLAGHRDPKVREGLAERRGVLDRFRSWAARHRAPGRPLLWMHAASVGEARQAEAVLELLRPAHPDWQVAATRFSPSARGLGLEPLADFSDCLPADLPAEVDRALAALRPTALVFSKLDLWPELAVRAGRSGSAVGMIGATVSPRSRRLGWPARALLHPGYRVLDRVGAISEADAARLVRLGVRPERIEITGDPRFDSAWKRARSVPNDDPVRRLVSAGPALVAGSTWPEDEARLLAAFRSVRMVRREARLVVVPHEPTPEHLAVLERMARELGLEAPERLSAGPGPEARLVVGDRMGILPACYAGAAIALVGGGFGTSGLHSVLEPAAAGVPVLFGPAYGGSPDAPALLQARGGIALERAGLPDWLDLDTDSTLMDASPLAALWLTLLRHPQHARAAGMRAREFVERGRGAAPRNARLVEALMAR